MNAAPAISPEPLTFSLTLSELWTTMATQHSEDWETTDVLISGGGPTGAILSAYLGRMSVQNIVLDREPDITPFPRAFGLGEDGVRHMQGLGHYDIIYNEMGVCEKPLFA